MISQAELKKKFRYNPKTGEFSRLGLGPMKVGHIKNGYLRINISKVSYSAHRLAWLYVYGEYPEGDIDHINHDRTDNRIANLRVTTRSANMMNASKSKANTSGFTGVTWDKVNCKWVAQYMKNGKCNKLGRFDSMLDAVAARIRANREHGFHENHGKEYA